MYLEHDTGEKDGVTENDDVEESPKVKPKTAWEYWGLGREPKRLAGSGSRGGGRKQEGNSLQIQPKGVKSANPSRKIASSLTGIFKNLSEPSNMKNITHNSKFCTKGRNVRLIGEQNIITKQKLPVFNNTQISHARVISGVGREVEDTDK